MGELNQQKTAHKQTANKRWGEMSGGLGIVDAVLLIPVILAADVVLAVVLMTVLGEDQRRSDPTGNDRMESDLIESDRIESDLIESDLIGRRALILTCGAGVVSGVIWILRFL